MYSLNSFEEIGPGSSPMTFTVLFGLAQGLGAVILVLLGVWLGEFRGGFAWTWNPALEFNWHPLLMTIGLIFLYGNSILVYRAFRTCSKRNLKLTHAAIHGGAFIFSVIGLQAAFDSHNLKVPPIPNLYTLHSWIGLLAVILFAVQLSSGFVAFLYPMLSTSVRSAMMPLHVYFGVAGFVLSVAAAVTGFTEKAIWSGSYEDLKGSEWILVNFIGMCIISFALIVVYLVTEPRYKRQHLPEEEVILVMPDSSQ